jgi:hypothetical protein
VEGIRITRSQFRRLVEFHRATAHIPEMLRKAGLTTESMLATLPQIRKEIYEEHYGKITPAEAKPRLSNKCK